MPRHPLPTLVLCALALLGSACATTQLPGPRPTTVLVLPPDSPELDPLLEEDRARLAEPWRRLVVEIGRDVLPRSVVEELAEREVLSVGLSAADLASFVTADPASLEERLGYRTLAAAHRADHLLKLSYDGSIRQGAGSVEWFGGWFTLSYPSDTVWYRLKVEAKLIDASTEQVVRTLSFDAEDHSTLIGQLGGRSNRDRMVDLTRRLSSAIAESLAP